MNNEKKYIIKINKKSSTSYNTLNFNKLYLQLNKINNLNKKIELLKKEKEKKKLEKVEKYRKIFLKNICIYTNVILFCKKLIKILKYNKKCIKKKTIKNNIKSFKNINFLHNKNKKIEFRCKKLSTRLISLNNKIDDDIKIKINEFNKINSPTLNKLKLKYNLSKTFKNTLNLDVIKKNSKPLKINLKKKKENKFAKKQLKLDLLNFKNINLKKERNLCNKYKKNSCHNSKNNSIKKRINVKFKSIRFYN